MMVSDTATNSANRQLFILLLLALLLNATATIFGLWQPAWWLINFFNFVLIVLLAQNMEARLPARFQTWYKRSLAFGFPILLLIAWEAVIGAALLPERWFPPPSKIAGALWDLTVTYDRFNESSLIGRPWLIPQTLASDGWEGVQALFAESHVWATLSRVLIGFVIGSLPGILLGIVMGLNKTVRMMLDSTLSALYVLPKIAIFPLVMLISPDPFGELPKITVVAISAFFLVTINTMAGVRDIDPIFIQAGKNFGAGRLQMFRHVIIPAALPIIFSGLRLAMGTALIVIVAIEFVRAQTGVGFIIFYSWQVLSTANMYAGLVVTMVLGVLLTYSLQWLEHRVMPWQKS